MEHREVEKVPKARPETGRPRARNAPKLRPLDPRFTGVNEEGQVSNPPPSRRAANATPRGHRGRVQDNRAALGNADIVHLCSR